VRRSLFAALLLYSLAFPPVVAGWNDAGHEIVARIAWDHMTPAARAAAIELLQAAPADACLRELMPHDARPLPDRQRELFMRAATWADIVRPQSKEDTRPCVRYHRATWHYINYFWRGQSHPDNPPPEDPDMAPPEPNALTQLAALSESLGHASRPRAERAIDLAWLLHLVGDIHQPLHTSARVSPDIPREQAGDRGGNDFRLGPEDDAMSLHAFWDRIVDLHVGARPGESPHAYHARMAATIAGRHPRAALARWLDPAAFDAWAREGFFLTRTRVYPPALERGRMPSSDYRRESYATAEQAIALAGYRLAALLDERLGGR
jgi:hypothetical protein